MLSRRLRLLAVCGLLFSTLILSTGCTESVREDRSINFSEGGDNVGFQHGDEGVFVANPETGEVELIFDPEDEVLASSSPLWAPVGNQLIFTTARSAEPNERTISAVQPWDASPAGRRFPTGEITYTCWLRAEPTNEDPSPKPQRLFEAACDHPGYVAANLAVRWHPNGGSIYFVDRLTKGRLGLFGFELATGQRWRVGRLSGSALIFDWSPGGKHLSCVVVDGKEANPQVDGIWILDANGDQAWRVPESEKLQRNESATLTEFLRRSRPAWHHGGERFAFAVRISGKVPDEHSSSAIFVAEVASRTVRRLLERREPIRELHWHPQAARLAVVLGDERPALHVVESSGETGPPLTNDPVRRFIGWDPSGRRFAYITPDHVPTYRVENWAFLFPPSRMPRDRVVIVDPQADSAKSTVLSGMRGTFPKWSPKGDKLSIWCTFSPTHRSWPSGLQAMGLQPGDPAAILDPETGELTWMAVNPHEKVQVGHYFLLKREYDQAWNWYEEAAEDRAKAPSASVDSRSPASRVSFEQSAELFEYICLTKLGRHADAARKLDEFHRVFQLPERIDDDGNELLLDGELAEQFARDSYVAEVYLSLDLAEDGVKHFEQTLANAQSDAERFVHAVILSQLLLLTERRDNYAQLAVETIAPFLIELSQLPRDSQDARPELREVVYLSFCLLPMFSPDFLAELDRGRLEKCTNTVREFTTQDNDNTGRLGIDLFLHAAFIVLGVDEQREEADQRIKENPRTKELLSGGSVEGLQALIAEACEFRW